MHIKSVGSHTRDAGHPPLNILLESFKDDLRAWPRLPRPDLFMCPRFLECGTKPTFPPVSGLNLKASY